MQFAYTILYVPDVPAAVDFYERAFGLARRFVHEGGQYAEMETGATALAFASEALSEANGLAIRPNTSRDIAAGIEICLATETPEQAYERAVAAGATPLKPVTQKPWGQRVGYVRDLNGCLVELCSPMVP
ncbi:MAG TPA: VOC family protein [Ideonella sp.]|uniref:VOC family protein n=1 Tax=Ideonella sp. TaxID=1929293 RepID=UPI002B9D5592|nr:VOC family protein [Ideonella sp.]HSI51258.1 VOC family protein [Ideonella sp.]